MTSDTFHDLVEAWIASSRKPLAPRTKQNYRATLHSFYDALHDAGLTFESDDKLLVDMVEKWTETLTRPDRIGEEATPGHQKVRKGKVQRFSIFAHKRGYAISDALLHLL